MRTRSIGRAALHFMEFRESGIYARGLFFSAEVWVYRSYYQGVGYLLGGAVYGGGRGLGGGQRCGESWTVGCW